MRRAVILRAGLVLLCAVVGTASFWAGGRGQPDPMPRYVDPVCAVTVSASPVPGAPSMLPDGTGTCTP